MKALNFNNKDEAAAWLEDYKAIRPNSKLKIYGPCDNGQFIVARRPDNIADGRKWFFCKYEKVSMVK